jgi:hypothetical protein
MFGLTHPNSSYGIGRLSFPTLEEDKTLPEPQIAYEMYKIILYNWRQEAILNAISKDKDPGWTVHDTLPLKYSDEPFIKIKKIEDDGKG